MTKNKKAIKKLKNSQINTPHDKLFKKSMQIPSVAKEFLMMHLPSNLKDKIAYDTLELLPETFIDETLRRSQVDALFKVKCGDDDLLIYILIEQQSQADYTIPTRRLSYKSDIWASYLEARGNITQTKLPPIIDLHFYTGDKPYNGPLCLADLAGDNAALINQCLTQPMINIWAGDITEEQLKTHPWAATLEYIMSNRRNNDLRLVMKNIAPNIRMFYLEKQNEYVISLYTYIENVYTYDLPVDEFARIAGEEISPRAKEDIMTIAEKLRAEGKLEGELEGELKGELKGKIATAQSMLADGVDPAFVAKHTKLPIAQVKDLQKKTISD